MSDDRDALQARIEELEAEAAGARTALANADQALDTLFARVEVLTVALTELVGLHNSGANGGRMVDTAWANARAALAKGKKS